MNQIKAKQINDHSLSEALELVEGVLEEQIRTGVIYSVNELEGVLKRLVGLQNTNILETCIWALDALNGLPEEFKKGAIHCSIRDLKLLIAKLNGID